LTNKHDGLTLQRCKLSFISVRYWLHSLSPHRCRFININRCRIRISRHSRCSQLCRDELNTIQCQAVHSLLLNIAVWVHFL